MAQSGSAGSIWGGDREPGARRKKVYGYLKAANELRQTYTAQLMQKYTQEFEYDEGYNVPGAFPDVEVARSGDEEMVLFPSYARRHTTKKPASRINRTQDFGTEDNEGLPLSGEELEYWKEEWNKYEDDHAVVDVDVRGWVYTPPRGQLTRKNRLLIALARKLCGVPAPTPGNGRDSSQPPSLGDKAAQPSAQEEELVNREAQSIISKAESNADVAWKGVSSEEREGREPVRRSSTLTIQSMGKDELATANANLMERLRPFLSNPLVGIPVTVFFFNDEQSQSRNVITNDAGHFSLRAALPFVPTEIRVLASDKLSVSKEVHITEPKGVSLISDVDDTIKHSAIASGAREIFKNTFVRELGELTVDGVSEWYSKLASMGVPIHYVSNSPWQVYPLLETYFKLADLPPGSFHLKQYSGMLQGIFEPTAERKKSSLEKIFGDFPERKFILVGDSGEADLEVYTDTVLAYPGRVLGIFIRDVTTSAQNRFFDKSVDRIEAATKRNRSTGQLIDHSDAAENRPALPPRKMPLESGAKSIDNADLIDLSEPEEIVNKGSEAVNSTSNKQPPMKPSKPPMLRTASSDPGQPSSNEQETPPTQNEAIRRKPAPPLPEKPLQLSTPSRGTPKADQPPPLPSRPKPSLPDQITKQTDQSQPETYIGTVRNAVANVYNNLPSTNFRLPGTASETSSASQVRSKQPPPVPPPRRSNTVASTASAPSDSATPVSQQTRPTPERFPSGAFSTAAQYASERLNWSSGPANFVKTSASTPALRRSNTANTNSDSDNVGEYVPSPPLPNKREELWRRRWERAKDILDREGVVLGSWRVGRDVEDVCIWLVEEAQKEMKEQEKDELVKT